jgi:FKBP-type peptidyl-prolyl cis-trans isomerase FklB
VKTVYKTTYFIGLLSVLVVAQDQKNSAQPKTAKDTLSYVLGRDVGEQLKDLGADLQIDAFTLGVEQSIKGEKSLIDSAKADSIRQAFATQAQEELQKMEEEAAEESKKAGEKFLSENKKRKGVETTKSGLQYAVLQKGNGDKPDASDTVTIDYKGMLSDSTVFDSSMAGQPATFELEKIIPGLREGIQLMREGAEYRFFIPADLAYGEQGLPPVIPPNAVLIFEVKLLNIGGQAQMGKK